MKWMILFLFLTTSLLFADLRYLTKTTPLHTDFDSVSTTGSHLDDDDGSEQVDLDFDFPFNGTTYDRVYIDTNGRIIFSNESDWSDDPLSSSSTESGMYPYWDDLDPRTFGEIKYGSLDVGGVNERFVVWWDDIGHFNSRTSRNGHYSFQAVLYRDGRIRFRYNDGDDTDGSDATIGVKETDTYYDEHSRHTTTILDRTKDILYTPTSISGHVYEDQNGDSQMADKIAKSAVTINLYRDSTTGSVYRTTTTDGSGYYAFNNLLVGEVYWVAVDSKTVVADQSFTVGNNQENIWAEQTYGGIGAQCADGSGGTITRSSAGSCFGGKDGAVSDDASAYSSSEHLTYIDTDGVNDNQDKDFGFSFNVVTSIRDGDDDSTDRSVQGSLRQFIQNANALDGANVMRFVPAVVKNETNWWKVTLSSALSSMDDDETTIDGRAYRLSDGTTVDNSNSGTSGNSSGEVGVQQHILPDYENKEFEIDGGGVSRIFTVYGDKITIYDLSIYNGGTGVDVQSGSDEVIVQRLFLGARADGSDPTNKLSRGFRSRSDSDDAQLLDSFIAYCPTTSAFISGTGEIRRNHFLDNADSAYNPDALTLEGNSASRNVQVIDNYIDGAGGYGIESWQAGGGFTIENNTIFNTGSVGSSELGGIRIFGSGSTLRYNIVHDTHKSGIVIVGGGSANIVSHNSIYSNGGLGIDLDQSGDSNPDGDGVTPNNGTLDGAQSNDDMDYPIVTVATYDGSTLHIEGYVGSAAGQSTFGSAELEVYIADDDGNNDGEVIAGDGNSVAHGEGKTFLFDCTTDSSGNFDCDHSGAVDTNALLTLTATLNSEGTSEFGANYRISLLPNMTITKTSIVLNDPVNGSTYPKRIPGATIRYCFTVDNTGEGDAEDATVTDGLAGDGKDNLSYVRSGSLIQDISTACDCATISTTNGTISGDEVTIVIGDINGTNDTVHSRGCAYIQTTID